MTIILGIWGPALLAIAAGVALYLDRKDRRDHYRPHPGE
jgi:hypothetical protein